MEIKSFRSLNGVEFYAFIADEEVMSKQTATTIIEELCLRIVEKYLEENYEYIAKMISLEDVVDKMETMIATKLMSLLEKK